MTGDCGECGEDQCPTCVMIAYLDDKFENYEHHGSIPEDLSE
jgi:hypothetical protein